MIDGGTGDAPLLSSIERHVGMTHATPIMPSHSVTRDRRRTMSDELREQLAAYAHEAWSGWMRYMFSKTETSERFFSGETVVVIPRWAVERWQRQMSTPYADLPEAEKKSDRKEADEILAIVATPTLPADVAATMREALACYKRVHSREALAIHGEIELEANYNQLINEMRAIDAALAWINAQEPKT